MAEEIRRGSLTIKRDEDSKITKMGEISFEIREMVDEKLSDFKQDMINRIKSLEFRLSKLEQSPTKRVGEKL